MGNRFNTEYVFIYDQENIPHFLQSYYGANLGDCYRSDIYLENKSYCVDDLYLTDEVEAKGDFLPYVKEAEWREFLSVGPSEDASTIISEAGLADVSISKLVFIRMESSSSLILELAGFVSTATGVQTFDTDFLNQAVSFARTKTGSPAEQEELIAGWIVEQVQKNY